MNGAHADFADWDAAYVLGALTPGDRRAYEDHLAACEVCRTAVAELAAMPGLLGRAEPLVQATDRPRSTGAHEDDARADATGVESEGRPGAPEASDATATRDPTLIRGLGRDEPSVRTGPRDDLVDAIMRREARRRRSVRTRVVIAAAGAAAAVGLALAVPAILAREPEPAATVALTAVSSTPLTASVAFEPVPWGTRLEVTCDYPAIDDDYGVTGSYVLVITDSAGEVSEVATWNAVPGKDITLAAATALPLEEIAAVTIQTAGGSPVLEASVAGS